MNSRTIAQIALLVALFCADGVWAYDCSALAEWKRQAYYLMGDEVQYQAVAYRNTGEPSKRDLPTAGYPWTSLGACDRGGGGGGGDPADPHPISIYGAWHCGDDHCTWSRERDMNAFDTQNHWLIDRDASGCDYTVPGDCKPSVNLVVLSFVHPLRLLHRTTDSQTLYGVPRGMTQAGVDYFKDQGIRVMLSIGGITYVDPWNQALAENAWQLGRNAAAVAAALGVGIEIDYEENQNPDLEGLQRFIDGYRSVHPTTRAAPTTPPGSPSTSPPAPAGSPDAVRYLSAWTSAGRCSTLRPPAPSCRRLRPTAPESATEFMVKKGLETCNEGTDDEFDQLDEAPVTTLQSRLGCQCVPNGTVEVVVEIPAINKNLAKEGH